MRYKIKLINKSAQHLYNRYRIWEWWDDQIGWDEVKHPTVKKEILLNNNYHE